MIHRKLLPLLALAVLVAFPAAAADTAMLRAVMPDAVFVAGADADRILTSPFGQFLLSKSQAEEQNLRKLVEMTGFDPRRDVREAVVASRTLGGRSKGLVMVRGTFDEAKLTAAAATHGAVLDAYKGVTVFALGSKKDGSDIVALLSSLAIAGPADDVRAAVDRYQNAQTEPAAIVAQVVAASAQWDAWAVTTGSPAQFAGAVHNPNLAGSLKGDVLQGITQTSGGVRFGANVELGGEAVMRSAQDAAALLDVYKFLLAMVQSNAPKTGAAASPFQSLIGSMNVTTSGAVVKFTAQLPESELEKLLAGGHRTMAAVR